MLPSQPGGAGAEHAAQGATESPRCRSGPAGPPGGCCISSSDLGSGSPAGIRDLLVGLMQLHFLFNVSDVLGLTQLYMFVSVSDVLGLTQLYLCVSGSHIEFKTALLLC